MTVMLWRNGREDKYERDDAGLSERMCCDQGGQVWLILDEIEYKWVDPQLIK